MLLSFTLGAVAAIADIFGGLVLVRAGDDALVVTAKGKIIRVRADEVTSQGRNTMGVRIIDLDADDEVGSIARVEAEQAPAPESSSA